MMAVKLTRISRYIFVIVLLSQYSLLASYPAKYKDHHAYIVIPVFTIVLYGLAFAFMALYLHYHEDMDLIAWLWLIWLFYIIGLVIIIGVIFGGIVIQKQLRSATHCRPVTNGTFCGSVKNDTFCAQVRNGTFCGPVRNHSLFGSLRNNIFLGPNVLKTTLSLTPALMLLLLKSVKDTETGDLKNLYFTTTLNLFDGIEMLEVLLEYGKKTEATPLGLEIVILIVVIVFYLLSFLELLHLKFKKIENESGCRERVLFINSAFQILLNLFFLALRLVLWFKYHRDAAIFIAKNIISLVVNVLPILIGIKWILDE